MRIVIEPPTGPAYKLAEFGNQRVGTVTSHMGLKISSTQRCQTVEYLRGEKVKNIPRGQGPGSLSFFQHLPALRQCARCWRLPAGAR